MTTSPLLNVAPTPSQAPTAKDVESCIVAIDKQSPEEEEFEASPFAAPPVPSPKLRLHFEDVTHPGTKAFLTGIPDPYATMKKALGDIVKFLYTPPSNNNNISFKPTLPKTRSVTFILRDFAGVAYTKGSSQDNTQKEIHFSLSYIQKTSPKEATSEYTGVIVHELVHCYQHSAPPNASNIPRPPSGLIEGIADFVRLKANLAPPHWKSPKTVNDIPERWDQGYQHTAYFLAWLEDVEVGTGAVGMLNDRLYTNGYTSSFWDSLFGDDIAGLWAGYISYVEGLGKKSAAN
ncbi:hypothetical protein FQN57_003869 [Myotisia sp. PD_48]|nr:hypothetical protein FQN57_003869 [Myotisia sp. PD_48]